ETTKDAPAGALHGACRPGPPCLSAQFVADDRHERHATTRATAQVVRQRQTRVGELPLAGLALELQPGFVEHPKTAGTYRVAEGLESPVRVDREAPVEVEVSRQHVLPRLPTWGEAEVLHQD